MGKLPAAVAVAALALVAAPAAGAKQFPWVLESEQTSARVGQRIVVKTIVTPGRYVATGRFHAATIGVYLVPGELAGNFFLKANTHVVELGTLEPDLEFRGKRSFEVPALAPGRYALGARVENRFLIGEDVLVVRRAALDSMEPFAALAGLGLAAALFRPRGSRRRRRARM
jgi:hypothetical protein